METNNSSRNSSRYFHHSSSDVTHHTSNPALEKSQQQRNKLHSQDDNSSFMLMGLHQHNQMGGMNLEEADKLAYGRRSQLDWDYSNHVNGHNNLFSEPNSQQQQTDERNSSYYSLPSSTTQWQHANQQEKSWEARDASSHSTGTRSSITGGSRTGGELSATASIWGHQQKRGRDDTSQQDSYSSHSLSSYHHHNNTTIMAGNLEKDSSSLLWYPDHQTQQHQRKDSFGFSKLSMEQGVVPGGPGDGSMRPPALNRRVSTDTTTGGTTPERSPNHKSSRFTSGVPGRLPHESSSDFDTTPPPFYLPSAASFSEHAPSLPMYHHQNFGGANSAADLVLASTASTFTNDTSLLNPSTVATSPSPSTRSASTLVSPPGFYPSSHAPQTTSYALPPHQGHQPHYKGQNHDPLNSSFESNSTDGYSQRSYSRKDSNRSFDSSTSYNRNGGGGGRGGGRRRNGRNNNHNNNSNNQRRNNGNRKQPRSNFPPAPLKERNSPPGKRTKDEDSFVLSSSPPAMSIQQSLLHRHKQPQDSDDSPNSNGTKKQLGEAHDNASWRTRNSQSPSTTTVASLASETRTILPQQRPEDQEDFSFHDFELEDDDEYNDDDDTLLDVNGDPILFDDEDNEEDDTASLNGSNLGPRNNRRHKWRLRMNRKLEETPVGQLKDAPILAVMNSWSKSKSSEGATMVEMWLMRAQQEVEAGNNRVIVTNKMYTLAVDAWARSNTGGFAARQAEALLQQLYEMYQKKHDDNLCPTTAIFNAVINAHARSKERFAPVRAQQILNWMQNLSPDLRPHCVPDRYTFNTVIHAYAKAGGHEAAVKAHELLTTMHEFYKQGNLASKPDTITFNVVINAWSKSGGKNAATEAARLLSKMHQLYESGDVEVKPNVVTYGAVIDAFSKCNENGAAARADKLLADLIEMYQSNPIKHSDLCPNTHVFNTVINCWAKSKEPDAASKAEEMLVAMSRLHSSGIPNLQPDSFTYTAVIDAWTRSGHRGAARRAEQLLDKLEAKYMAGDSLCRPNTFTFNAVINALGKSGEPGAAARAERVLQNMVNRYRNGGDDDVKPTTINFNTVLDAWAKSGGGRAAAERCEEIIEWMDHLNKQGNNDIKPDTITFNACLDSWARSGDRTAPRRCEQILDHMDELFRAGNQNVKPDTYTYNTLINAWAKSSLPNSAGRATHVLNVMEKRYRDGDSDFKPNTRTYTSVVDALAKSGERRAAQRCEEILNNMITRYEATGDADVKPNVHTANAVCNSCAFSKHDEDRVEALQIAFRVFEWLNSQEDMSPDSYSYTILLSVCANLIPRHDTVTRYSQARAFFERCCDTGYVNDYVLRKLRQTVTEQEFQSLIGFRPEPTAMGMPPSWTRNARVNPSSKNQHNNQNRRGRQWQGRKRY